LLGDLFEIDELIGEVVQISLDSFAFVMVEDRFVVEVALFFRNKGQELSFLLLHVHGELIL